MVRAGLEHGAPLLEEFGGAGRCGNTDASGGASHQVLDRAEQALSTGVGALRGEGVGLVQHQVQGVHVPVIEPFGEIGHATPAGELRTGGPIQHREDMFVADQV
ncbi:MAG: hypothetical protein ACR2LE_09200, partial [Nocardioidaceae bacterium]